jgi:hypothetical protein
MAIIIGNQSEMADIPIVKNIKSRYVRYERKYFLITDIKIPNKAAGNKNKKIMAETIGLKQ